MSSLRSEVASSNNNDSDPDVVEVENIVIVEDSDVVVEVEVPNPKKKTAGRIRDPVWSLFSEDEEAIHKKSAYCKHCKLMVNYHKKSESVKLHLRSCQPFKKMMNGKDIEDRPAWYPSRKRSSASGSAASSSVPIQSVASSNQAQSLKKPKMKQTNISSFVLPRTSTQVKSKFQELMAMHYFVTGTSFQRIEEENLSKAIALIRPDVVLPDRKKVAGPLLDKCYKQLKNVVDKYLANQCVCLTTDGWTNILNNPIVNYMVVNSHKSLFLESVSTGEQGHTADWIASDIERVMRSNLKTSFAGAVTDNTSANKNAWRQLKEAHPTCFFQGCTSHCLHLLVKEVFSASKTRKGSSTEATYPVGYPFEDLLQFAIDCKDIVKFFHNHHVPKAQLEKAQGEKGLIRLAAQVPTRWGTIQKCFSSILRSEGVLQAMVSARDFVQGSTKQKEERMRIKEIITADTFVPTLKKCLEILIPLDRLIVKYQSDSIPVSEVLPDFHALQEQFQKSAGLSQQEINYLISLAQIRFQFMYGDAHGLAYLMDPRFIGEGLPQENRRSLEDIIIAFPAQDDAQPNDHTRKTKLYTEFQDFIISAQQDKDHNGFRYRLLQDGSVSPMKYWLTDGRQWPCLQAIAIKLFTMATSSTASERNFSTFGFIHSKLRNSLGPEKVFKLVYIKTNYPSFSEKVVKTGVEHMSDVSDIDCDQCDDIEEANEA